MLSFHFCNLFRAMSVIFTRPTSTQVLEHLFVGRRGVPQVVHCDNETNFVGASRHFEELRRKIEAEERAIRAFSSKSGCTFAFIPPRASHFGGLWEAGVKTAKSLLQRVVGSALLSVEELQTVLVGVDAMMNWRPLGPLSQDSSDGEALTPAHLLIDESLNAPPAVGTPDQQGLSCLKRWRLVSSLKRMFWQRWSREYVLGLQTRAKWHQQQQNIAVEDLVVVAEDNMPSQQWLAGRNIQPAADHPLLEPAQFGLRSSNLLPPAMSLVTPFTSFLILKCKLSQSLFPPSTCTWESRNTGPIATGLSVPDLLWIRDDPSARMAWSRRLVMLLHKLGFGSFAETLCFASGSLLASTSLM
ncbi:hypothetical protein ACLKA6_016280 [Drosophila palustris]